MVRRLLVANRGEIASRVFRTCRRLGIETVAVHSDADADLPFVYEADHAVRLPGNSPTDTYLRADLLIDAARRTGADAVHPGYGFLSENAEFARAVIDAGLTWIGPPAEAIEAMGSKVRAKELMREAGIPVLEAPEVPTEGDLPLLVKASAGGGGRGMRVVRRLEGLAAEVAAAQAEAESAFGDGTVFVEPYVERGRHVEVQVMGTDDGVLVLGERDCSVQRRHQKLVEESPAPGLPEATRGALHEAARAAAASVDYRGAGTVEFLYDADADAFYFLEMNTRLQVEHPVTEAVLGIDLVEMQIEVAEGGVVSTLDLAGPGHPVGHAIEVRLYAEDPAADYRPQSGLLSAFETPAEDGIRVDAGYGTGSTVSIHYDAMLAKVVAHARTREQAARRLVDVLRRARIHGVRSNRDLLVEILRNEAFLSGELSTELIARHDLAGRLRVPGTAQEQAVSCFAAAMACVTAESSRRPVQRGIPAGWRNVVSGPQVVVLDLEGTEIRVGWLADRTGPRLADQYGEVDHVRLVSVDGEGADRLVTVDHAGVRTRHAVRVAGRRLDVDSPWGHFALVEVPRFTDPADAVASGSLLAPMPGTVVSVAVEVGAEVAAGQTVLVLEAMKMQHTVSAPHAGVVSQIEVTPGAQVAAGEVLAVVEGADE